MIGIVDTMIDRITMYRLVLYVLIVDVLAAFVLSFFVPMPFSHAEILLTAGLFLVFCFATDTVFSFVFRAPRNVESVYITALILTLIITPVHATRDMPLVFWASVLSIASKYIFAVKRKHLFNPAAMGVVLTAIGAGESASWWVGTLSMIPVVVFGGYLIVRKIKREDLVFSFLFTVMVLSGIATMVSGGDIFRLVKQMSLNTALLFFASVMLTEPLTSPGTKKKQIAFGVLTGALYVPWMHLGPIYSTPELALVVGNLFSYFISSKEKLFLHLKNMEHIGDGLYDFVFPREAHFTFTPGQYVELTVPHDGSDSRGVRRYFTLASSPTEDTIRFGVKVQEQGSSYKRVLRELSGEVIASCLSGEFTLPKDVNVPMVWIAGGIGITPYRSMAKYLIDRKEKRSVVLLYVNKRAGEIVYKDVFDIASKEVGLRAVYALTDTVSIPKGWLTGSQSPDEVRKAGRIDEAMLREILPDYLSRTYFLSGPHAMVEGYRDILKKLGVPEKQIITDYFPGF
ncbi:RnfABCDGE type electron transport complex subunit D [Candidatus Gottesmanbacteria bacterium]|nr:RnfABCDGE type electron transport complex subunit D [Candidatus Gottesmanbacteria bacterium]